MSSLVVPKCFQLVGVPASGKTTWTKKQTWALGLTVVSTDPFVEEYARSEGKTYSDVFEEAMPMAIDQMLQQVERARELGHCLIWDQTSTTVRSRSKKFQMLPDYEHIAVVFETPNRAELSRRLGSRPGKTIPQEVMETMIENFQYPTFEEGFKEIWKGSV